MILRLDYTRRARVAIVPGTPPGAGGERNRYCPPQGLEIWGGTIYCPPRVSDPGGELSLKISSPPAGWGGTTCLKEEMFWGGTKSVRFLASKSHRNTRYGAEKAATVWRACGAKILCFPARNTQFFLPPPAGLVPPQHLLISDFGSKFGTPPQWGGTAPPRV